MFYLTKLFYFLLAFPSPYLLNHTATTASVPRQIEPFHLLRRMKTDIFCSHQYRCFTPNSNVVCACRIETNQDGDGDEKVEYNFN